MTNSLAWGKVSTEELREGGPLLGDEQISILEVGCLQADEIRITARLGDPAQDALVDRFLTGAARQASDARAYAIEWTGGRVPRGLELEGRQIGWMQHGVVKDTDGHQIGFYERLRDNAGADGRLQSVLVILTGPKPEPGTSPTP